MPNTATCPDRDSFVRLASGLLPAAEAEQLASHLESCVRCVDTVASLKGQDTLVEALRGSAETGEIDASPAVQQLIDKLKQLRPPAEPLTLPPKEASRSSDSTGDLLEPPPLVRDMKDFLKGKLDSTPESLAPPQAPDELGRLGPYRVLKELGAGGMGTVYLAEDPHLQRHVALKTMKPTLAASSAARERFLREARATAKVKHDHVVTIHQVGEERGIPFLAMELLEGETLDARLRRESKLPVAEVLRIGQEIARGLAAAHKRGLLHRDIKPANIWLENRNQESGIRSQESGDIGSLTPDSCPLTPDRVKIVDFGLARAASGDAQLTQEGAIIGTPAYMAPEQATNTNVDHRCDLFSLGCVLYRMAAGVPAFKGTDTISTLMSVATDQPVPPCALNFDIPTELSDYILKLLEKRSEKRPASALEVAERLRALQRDVLSSPPLRGRGVGGEGVGQTGPHPQPLPEAGRGARRTPRRVLIGATVALLGLGSLAFFYGGTIIRIASNEGELVIEIADDARIEVTIKDGEAIVHDKAKDRKYVLTAGKDYEVQVRELGEDGVKFGTKRFTITRGGQARFDARMGLPMAKAADKLPPVANADATAAKLTEQEQALLAAINAERAKANVPPLVANATLMKAARRHADDMARWDNLTHVSEDKNLLERIKETVYEHKGAGENVALNQATPAEAVQIWMNSPGHKENLLKPAFLEVGLGISRSSKNQPYYAAMFAAPVNLPRTADADRRIAEWVLSAGGKVQLRAADGLERTYEGAATVLPPESLPLITVELPFGGSKPTKAAELEQLRILSALRTLVIERNEGVTIDDDWLATMGQIKTLESIDLKQEGNLRITPAGLAHLERLPRLNQLALHADRIEPAVLEALIRLPKLSILELTGSNITDADVARFAQLGQLEQLGLEDSAVTGTGLAHLKALPLLRVLVLARTKLRDADLAPLSGFRTLTRLNLEKTSITDAGLESLKACKQLEELELLGVTISADGVKQLAAALPRCKVLSDHGTFGPVASPSSPAADRAGLTAEQRRALEWVLSVGGSLRLVVDGKHVEVSSRDKLPDRPFQVYWVYLRRQRRLGDAALENLKAAPPVRQLYLDETAVTDAGMAQLASYPGFARLLILNLNDTTIGDVGLEHIARLSYLGQVRLRHTRVSAAGVKKLTTTLRGCKVAWDSDPGEPKGSSDEPSRITTLIPPRASREATVIRGTWEVTDDGLIQHNTERQFPVVLFGDPTWRDYDFSVEAMRMEGNDQFALFFRVTDASTLYWFGAAEWSNTLLQLGAKQRGDHVLRKHNLGLKNNQWYTARAQVRGKHIKCSLSEADRLLHSFEIDDDRHSAGRVGLRTCCSAVRFRDIKVTAPDGKVLWEGPPDLPGQSPWKGPAAPVDEPGRFTNSLGMEFALVPKGKAWLGGGGMVGTKQVEFKEDFYLSVYEVTQEEWQKIMGSNPSHFSRTGKGKSEVKAVAEIDLKAFPVEGFTMKECQEFLARLNEKRKESGWVYRLPTEAEWEYACRGGPLETKDENGFDYYLDRPTNQLSQGMANFNKNLGRTCKVGSYSANRLGLYDMHGNVWELCSDTELIKAAVHHVNRGGCWDNLVADCRTSSRHVVSPFTGNYAFGLRVARVPVPVDADARVPAVGRKADVYAVKPYWAVADGELLFGSGEFKHHWLFFGDKNWTDYDVQAQVLRLAGGPSFSLAFRSMGPNFENAALFTLGSGGNQRGGVELNLPGQYFAKKHNGVDLPTLSGENARFAIGRWNTVKVEVRGSTCRCYVNGEMRATFDHLPFQRGRVGLRIEQATFRFRDLSVTAPDGTVLWTGLPNLPASPLPVPAGLNEPRSATKFTNSLGMEFALVPKGKAWMGGMAGTHGNSEVELKEDFYLGVYEVTQEEWHRIMGVNPSEFTRTGKEKDKVKDVSDADLKRLPVTHVSWNDCQEFIARLNERTKEKGWIYRLPMAEEWQYACRGGSLPKKEDYAFDYYLDRPTNTLLPDRANFNNTLGRPAKVGSYPANSLGLFDMHGNMAELLEEKLSEGKWGPHTRVTRGGGFSHPADWCRTVFQVATPDSARFHDIGLRLARVRVP